MPILLIETSTERGIFACFQGHEAIFSEELPFGSSQSQHLMPRLAAALKENEIKLNDLTCVGVGIGPGSYTGIRIGVAVAQALAYSCSLPLIGASSLDGFVPSKNEGLFAAILDARIGGVYIRKGYLSKTEVHYLSDPAVYSLEEAGPFLSDVKTLVTPSARLLKLKLEKAHPAGRWEWEERAPSPFAFLKSVEKAYQEGSWKKEGVLELLYLRETEAEREKNKQKNY